MSAHAGLKERVPDRVDRETARARELEEQRRWRLKPERTGSRVFDELLENEFRTPEEHRARDAAAVRKIVRFAVEQVPWYQALFARRGFEPGDIDGPEDLAKLPVLTKHDVLNFAADLTARALPPGDSFAVSTKSSGTTGRPVAVRHSWNSAEMSGILKQRNSRWFRLDPFATRVDVRASFDVARHRDGTSNPAGTIVRYPGWRQLSRYFETGTEYGFNVSNPIEQQIAWLKRLRPDYVMTYPGTFEEWLLANDGKNPAPSIKGLIGVGAQLTEAMNRRITEGFGVPIHMGYGLNEIGKVAVRCFAGRYHVNTEHCLVQIVRDDGSLCAHGETGHLLVTGLRNHAMPLFRYDTGDLAEAAEGACACGRTLPGFGEIAGRFRRYAGLPALSRERVRAIRTAIEDFPAAGLSFLRRYQIHQDLSDRYTLRLTTVAPVPEAFRAAVLASWGKVAGDPPMELPIALVDEIATSPAGKLLDFVSDFHADSSAAPAPWIRESQ